MDTTAAIGSSLFHSPMETRMGDSTSQLLTTLSALHVPGYAGANGDGGGVVIFVPIYSVCYQRAFFADVFYPAV